MLTTRNSRARSVIPTEIHIRLHPDRKPTRLGQINQRFHHTDIALAAYTIAPGPTSRAVNETDSV